MGVNGSSHLTLSKKTNNCVSQKKKAIRSIYHGAALVWKLLDRPCITIPFPWMCNAACFYMVCYSSPQGKCQLSWKLPIRWSKEMRYRAKQIAFACPALWRSLQRESPLHKPKADQCRVSKRALLRPFCNTETQMLYEQAKNRKVLIAVSSGRLFPVAKAPPTLSQTKIVFPINHEYKLPGQDESEPSMEKNATEDLPQDV